MQKITSWRLLSKLVAMTGFLIAASAVPAHADTPALPVPPGLQCQAKQIPVTIIGTPAQLTIAATLCGRAPVDARTIQILVPGFTYGQVYWNFPHQPSTYSYVYAATAAGYATLTLDRLGTGLSSHPAPALVTFDNQVAAIHQVVAAVRQGTVTGSPAQRVILAGHSLGSGIAAAVQVLHPEDADALMLTGFSHSINAAGVAAAILTATWPAYLESRFTGLPPGYFTTIPGTRAITFYAPGTADPNVQAMDEATKETTANAVEFTGINLATGTLGTNGIHVPVLVAAGALDTIVCGLPTCLALESLFYGTPDVTTISMPDTGHDLNLSYSAPLFFTQAITWANDTIGTLAS